MPIDDGRASRTATGSSGACSACAAQMRFRLECEPRFDYARDAHEVVHRTSTACVFALAEPDASPSTSPVPLELERHDGVCARVHAARRARRATFVLEQRRRRRTSRAPTRERRDARGASSATVDYWRRWLVAVALPRAAGARWCTARR